MHWDQWGCGCFTLSLVPGPKPRVLRVRAGCAGLKHHRMPVSFGLLKAKQLKLHPAEPIPVLEPAPFLWQEGLRSIP